MDRVSRGSHYQNDDEETHHHRRRHYNGEASKCSGKRCRSWAAGAIADCVALCCCPCAIINLLTLTFVKVPWMIGRKCLSSCNKKKNKNKKRKKMLNKRQRRVKINDEDDDEFNKRDEKCGCYGGGGGGDYDDHRFVVERDGSLTKEDEEEEEVRTMSFKGGDEERISARVEAERVWLELYQIGHLGFGRVSFTGIQ